jgi:predicted ATP-grasp superfamily ATP-dependent carboligase
MATVRALAEGGVDVHAFVFRREDPLHHSRYAVKIPCYHLQDDPAGLVQLLIAYGKKLGGRPVLLPTGDAHALLLAKHSAELQPHYRIWDLPSESLGRIVNKTTLYQAARSAGTPVIPSLSTPTIAEVVEWSLQHPGPYLLKPSYDGIGTCKLRTKNLLLETREQLVNHVSLHGSDSLVIQRMIRGGDGNIFDCYGLCDREGRVVSITSHQRLRQFPPDFGTTSMGEIPAALPSRDEQFLFAATEQFFNTVRFNGIFGIEWLREETTGAFYLIDFNARPFLTIGHLYDCGVNLPLLAYRELTGQSLADVKPRPVVQRKRWVYISNDIDTFRELRATGRLDFITWLLSLATCRSFAYVSWSDPLPGIHSLLNVFTRALRFALRMRRSTDLAPGDSSEAARSLPR